MEKVGAVIAFVVLDLSNAYEHIFQPLLPDKAPERLDMPESILPWIVLGAVAWGILATFNDVRRRFAMELDDEVNQVVDALSQTPITINSKTESVADVLLKLQTSFATGSFGPDIQGLLEEHYSSDGEDELNDAYLKVLTELRVQGIISSIRELWRGEYIADRAPIEVRRDYWTLTDLGSRVILRLR